MRTRSSNTRLPPIVLFADVDEPGLGELPGSLGTGEAAADDVNVMGHRGRLSGPARHSQSNR